jgi:hypothetical protein
MKNLAIAVLEFLWAYVAMPLMWPYLAWRQRVIWKHFEARDEMLCDRIMELERENSRLRMEAGREVQTAIAESQFTERRTLH